MTGKRKGRYFLESVRIQIVREIESGKLSRREAEKKYGIKGHSTILKWLKDYGKGSCCDKKKGHSKMGKVSEKRIDLKSSTNEIKALKEELERARAKNVFLETMIDIAEEEFDIKIRKKYGARQLKK